MITITLGTVIFHYLVELSWGWSFLSAWFLYNLFCCPTYICSKEE